jgi:hypothetical protein
VVPVFVKKSVGSCNLVWKYEGKSEIGRCRHKLIKGIAVNWMWRNSCYRRQSEYLLAVLKMVMNIWGSKKGG